LAMTKEGFLLHPPQELRTAGTWLWWKGREGQLSAHPAECWREKGALRRGGGRRKRERKGVVDSAGGAWKV
jgi:hypothetical protein